MLKLPSDPRASFSTKTEQTMHISEAERQLLDFDALRRVQNYVPCNIFQNCFLLYKELRHKIPARTKSHESS